MARTEKGSSSSSSPKGEVPESLRAYRSFFVKHEERIKADKPKMKYKVMQKKINALWKARLKDKASRENGGPGLDDDGNEQD
ncbi:hypothetical protein JCM8547_002644 [Rhodosporidiobolus lusitaniae]